MNGDLIKKMKLKGTKRDLRDDTLYLELSKVEGMEWVKNIYLAGNSFVHLEKSHIFSSLKVTDELNGTILMSMGFHDGFIPENEKLHSAIWMNKIIDNIILQAQFWMLEKAEKVGFDIDQLNR